MSKYLAILHLASGSSHGRAATIDEAVEICLEEATDWASIFDIEGKPAKLAIYDVENYDSLHWDHQVWADGHPDPIPVLEVRDVTLYSKRRR